MRRLMLVLAAGGVWLFLFAIPAFADNGPHHKGQFVTSLQGSCAGCHRAHSAQAPLLLKDVMPNLCYACHGAGAPGSTTDVVNGVPSGGGAGLRGGGFQFALIDTDNSQNTIWNGAVPAGDSNKYIGLHTSSATQTSHSVNGQAVSMWGSGALGTSLTPGTNTYTVTTDLTCGSCHDPHGNGQYRILKPKPDDAATTAAAYINDVPLAGSYNYTTANYGTGDVSGTAVPYVGSAGQSESALNVAANSGANGPTGSLADGSAIQYVPASLSTTTIGAYYKGTYIETASRWCTTCHTRYEGYRGSAGQIVGVTDSGTGDATYKFLHATRTLVDPLNPGAAAGVVLNPLNTGQVLPSGTTAGTAAIGCYTSSGITYNGVAVKLGTLADPAACANNTSGLLSSTTVPARDPATRLSTGAPKCITCHVSHGSNATDILTGLKAETSLVTGAALHSPLLRLDGRGVCQNCHNK